MNTNKQEQRQPPRTSRTTKPGASGHREIVLALPPPREGYSSLKMIYPPLSLLSIASFLKREQPETHIRILDGQVMDMESMMRSIIASPPDVMGLSVSLLNYMNGLELAEAAKQRGACVVFGGHYATSIPERILNNRPFVDAVVSGDGERAFTDIAAEKPWRGIDNLTYRDRDDIVRNKRVNLDLAGLPLPDYALIEEMNAYINTSLKFKKVFISYAQKGCLWRERSGGCAFCARQDEGYRRKPPEIFWEEIRRIRDAYNPDLIYEVSDSFATDRMHLARIARGAPKDLPPMRILSKTTDITEQSALLLKRINVYEVFVGIESGDPGCLKRINKGTTPRSNLKAARILKENGIRFFPSIILGNPGETPETMEKTMQHLEALCKEGDVERVYGNIMLPYPGSELYERLMTVPGMEEKYAGTDIFDIKELQLDWAEHFCSVTYDQMLERLNEADLANVFTTPNFDKADLMQALHRRSAAFS
ncbi:MAG: B12-binding domain-containing radical SAM protein [Deltaproteobacteria bacterium]|nr:B12-binding domain-containing radical SAM protein [Deltaproteobacteria bacterium]